MGGLGSRLTGIHSLRRCRGRPCFRAIPARAPSGTPWRVRPLVKLRSALGRRELIHRLTRYREAQAAPHERRHASITASRLGSSTFTIEYSDESRRFVVRGRILEGVDECLVLLRFDRPVRLWLFVVTALSIATAIWAGFGASFDPSFLFIWILLPLLGLVPADFLIRVSDEFRELVAVSGADVATRSEGEVNIIRDPRG